jgi:hypothetical protein
MTEFPIQLPHGPLREVLPDIFFVSGQSRPDFGGRTLQFSRNMLVVRDGQDLTLLNTLRLDSAGLAALDALGTVRSIVKLGSFHGRDDAFYLNRYDAPFWAPEGMSHERDVTATHHLVAGGAVPVTDGTSFLFETASSPEAILHLGRHNGILISCDSLQNWTEADEFFDEATAALMAKQGFFHPANVGPGWRRSVSPEARDFARLKSLNFRHLLSAHGQPLLNDAHAAVHDTIERLFST